MTRAITEMALGRAVLAFTERDPGAPFRWVPGDNPDLPSGRDGVADAVLIETIHRWDPAKLNINLREIKRLMRTGGLLRISTPNLDAAIHAYLMEWDDSQDNSRAARFNEWWRTTKSQFLFNEEELRRILMESGFVDLQSFVVGASSDPLFWDAGHADKTILVMEARKPKVSL
jgi:predicted SAM-dependent methyltransferase